MKIIILGGGGFIGSNIADSLLSEGHEIVVFERESTLPYRTFDPNEKLTWVRGDFTNHSQISEVLKGADLVIHLISTTLPNNSNDNPYLDADTNLMGTLSLLDAMISNDVKSIIFASSGGTVYGNPKYLPIDENHPTQPIVSYGITKLAIENYLLLYKRLHQLDVKIMRISNPYGIGQLKFKNHGVITHFLKNTIDKKEIEIWGDGNAIRDYLYIDDLSRAVSLLIKYQGPHLIFNISSGHGVSLNDIITAIESICSEKTKALYKPSRVSDVDKNILANNLARLELNWQPQNTLKDGISKLLSEIKNND